jgi:hypothetical protein
MQNECQFSPCRRYRYVLHYGCQKPDPAKLVMFIGLNPSTADETGLDATLRRVRRFAFDWGYNSFIILNLFGYRTIDPRELKKITDPVGPENDYWIEESAPKAELIVVAWGTLGSFCDRAETVSGRLSTRKLCCVGVTRDGSPRHPLYVRSDAQPMPWHGVSNPFS